MAYIGRGTDKISNIEKLDVITFDGSSSYTLQKNSVNFTPNSANSLQVSIDGVVQAGNFTVSGSTIDFGVAIPATSTCDFIFHYGTGLVTTVSDGAITTAKLGDASVTSAKLDAGKVLQVVSTTKTDTFSSNPSNSFIDITGLSATITPTSTSSKIYVVVTILGGGVGGTNSALYRLVRDSTVIYAGDSAGSRALGFSHQESQNTSGSINGGGNFLDSPSTTSATTYKIQATSNNTIYINRTADDSDTLLRIRGASTITLMEISG